MVSKIIIYVVVQISSCFKFYFPQFVFGYGNVR